MKLNTPFTRSYILSTSLSLFCLLLIVSAVRGQQPKASQETGDVIRINTELVQTDVMVFDKQGRFVDNLQREQFQLTVDGKPQPVTFFEQVATGSQREERLRRAVNEPAVASTVAAVAASSKKIERGRTIVFFVDDLHLELTSLNSTRLALTHFVDTEMQPDDQVAIASSSGHLGFLQQFTDNKRVLRAAIERLKPVPYVVLDNDKPPMTEYLAIRIEHNDSDAIEYYVEELRKGFRQGRGVNEHGLAETVKNRAHQIVLGLEAVTANSLASLESLMRSSAELSGRKQVFFFSDGFYLDGQKSGSVATDMLRRVTDAAVRTGVVIYTIDARGLISGQLDATNLRPFDPKGRLDRANVGEITISQDGLNALAADTGGRALRNANVFDEWITRSLKETSNYYLLAWSPPEEHRGGKFKRIEVSVSGRPDLTVRLPRGYLETDAKTLASNAQAKAAKAPVTINVNASTATTNAAKTPDSDLRAALAAPATRKSVPTQLNVSYLDAPSSGALLTASVQVSTAGLSYGADGTQNAAVDIAGVVLNEQGTSVSSFKTRLNVNPLPANVAHSEQASVIYNYKATLAPGLYQVRAAARDDKSGLVGSAQQWIEIPDLASKRLTLSSLLVGGQLIEKGAQKTSAAAGNSDAASSGATSGSTTGSVTASSATQVQFSVDRRFNRSAKLSFWVFIYNAAAGSGAQPDVTAQVQVLRGAEAIVTTAQRKLQTAGMNDVARIPYGGEFALSSLAPGRYVLQVTVTDKIANTSATQRTAFVVE